MKVTSSESKYWKCEYENLRRKKIKELNDYQIKTAKFVASTLKLLKMMGLSDKDIAYYYKKERENDIC